MADLLYCGTNPVGADDTQAMLAGEFRAIWAPPMHRNAAAKAGDWIWVLWRATNDDSPILIGGGIAAATPEGKIDWTNRTAQGIAAAARARGYGGPTNMAFLRLDHVRLPDHHIAVPRLGLIPIGLSAATLEQAAELQTVLPIGSEREASEESTSIQARQDSTRLGRQPTSAELVTRPKTPELIAAAGGDMFLPYDMGNAGDLVKHGLLAEFTQWWCENESKQLRFLDPFAGRLWVSPLNTEVSRRVKALLSAAMRRAQPDPDNRYYGSSYVVLNVAHALGCAAEVLISDSDADVRRAFERDGFRRLECDGFSQSDSFSILDSDCRGDLVLLDPFGNFLRDRASDVIPKLGDASYRFACILFVLNRNPRNLVGRQYGRLRADHLSAAWSLLCPKLPHRGMAGESRYEVEVLLTWRRLADHPRRNELRQRLNALASSLSKILDARVVFSAA